MDIDTQVDLEVRMREEVEQLLVEIETGKEGAAPPESLDGTIGRLSEAGRQFGWIGGGEKTMDGGDLVGHRRRPRDLGAWSGERGVDGLAGFEFDLPLFGGGSAPTSPPGAP